jgi:hypothetical protein
MALNMAASDYQYDLCREFAMLHQLVHVEVSEVSIPNLSAVYQPSSDCICDRPKQHSPSYVHHHENVESHDRLMSQVLRNKRNDRHRAQKLRDGKVAPHGDMESLQIYLNG